MRRRSGLILAAVAGAGAALVAMFVSVASRERLDALCGSERSLLGMPIDCSKVTGSEYGTVFGVALSSWGFGLYVALVGVAVVALTRGERGRASYRLLVIGAAALAVYTVILLVTQVAILGALCLFCLTLYAGHALLFAGTWLAAEQGLWAALKDAAHLFRRLHREPLVLMTAAAMALSVVAVEGAARAERRDPAGAEFLAELAGVRALAAPLDLNGAAASGPQGAPYVVVLFSDFLCPFCRQAAHEADALKREHAREVRVVFKHYPLDTACNPHVGRNLHPGACEAARAAVCAEWAGRFWQMHDTLFAAQSTLAGASRDTLLALGERAGLAPAALGVCLDDASSLDQVRRDIDEGYAAGVPGTPAIVMNGRPLYGPSLPPEAVAMEVLRSVVAHGLWR